GGRRGCEDQLDVSERVHGQQALGPLMGGGHLEAARPCQAVRLRVDACHGGDLQRFREPEHLDHEVGGDVPGADDGDLRAATGLLAGHVRPSFSGAVEGCGAKPTCAVPRSLIVVVKVSPRPAGVIGPKAPVSTMSPARSGSPSATNVAASQTAALSGPPRQSLPVPSETTSSPRVRVICTERRSTFVSGTGVPPRTNSPHEALSATVSTMLMSQSATRLSTISRAGRANSTARRTSATVGSANCRSSLMTKATSASTLGWSMRPWGIMPPLGTAMSDSR